VSGATVNETDPLRAPVTAVLVIEVNRERGDVGRSDDAPDWEGRAQLFAPLVEVVAED
jgi:hypothetical protein